MNFLGNQTEQRKSEKLENEQIGIMKVSDCIKRNKNKNKKIIITRSVELSQTFTFLFIYFVFFFSKAQSFTLRKRARERIQEVKNLYLAFSFGFEETKDY